MIALAPWPGRALDVAPTCRGAACTTRRFMPRPLVAVCLLVVSAALVSGYAGAAGQAIRKSGTATAVRRRGVRNLWQREELGLATFHSQIGQDKWVLETVFPGVSNGFFVDVGSADGAFLSNTKALERRGWTGSASTLFPRTCRGGAAACSKRSSTARPGGA